MVVDKDADDASDAKQLLFVVNATNGFINIVWWNNDAAKPVGNWIYQITLEKLWALEDAFNFDEVCRFALFDFTEDHMITDEGDSVYDIFLETELNEIEEVLV